MIDCSSSSTWSLQRSNEGVMPIEWGVVNPLRNVAMLHCHEFQLRVSNELKHAALWWGQGLHALFTGEDDSWEAWLCVDTTGISFVLGLRGSGVKLRRGFTLPEAPQPTQVCSLCLLLISWACCLCFALLRLALCLLQWIVVMRSCLIMIVWFFITGWTQTAQRRGDGRLCVKGIFCFEKTSLVVVYFLCPNWPTLLRIWHEITFKQKIWQHRKTLQHCKSPKFGKKLSQYLLSELFYKNRYYRMLYQGELSRDSNLFVFSRIFHLQIFHLQIFICKFSSAEFYICFKILETNWNVTSKVGQE